MKQSLHRFIRKSFFILPVLGSLTAAAQIPIYWGARYNGLMDGPDEALAIVVDASGNSYVTGSSLNTAGNLDAMTIKYTPTGQTAWARAFNGTANDNDQASNLVLDASGNVYVVGYAKGTSSMNDLLTIKYDNSGNLVWSMTYNGSFNNSDQGADIAVDGSGNVYVTGYVTTSNYTYDIVTVKYNSSGTQQWAMTYDGPGNFNDDGRGIAVDGSGNVYTTGPSDTLVNNMPNSDAVILKYNSSGVLQWRRVYNSSSNDFEYSKDIQIDGNGDLVIMGYGSQTGNGNDYLVMKYNTSGVQQWVHYYNSGGQVFEEAHALAIDASNNIIITGQGVNGGTNDYLTVKWNSGGTQQWAMRYNGPVGEDRAYGIDVDDTLNIYVTGFSMGTGTGMDYATVKYDAAGTQDWVVRYNNTPNLDDVGNAVAYSNGNVWVTGRSDNATNYDYLTLCYSYAAVGLSEIESNIMHMSLYPNPSSDVVNIVLDGESAFSGETLQLHVYDMAGRELRTENFAPVNGKPVGGFSISGMASGAYFVSVTDKSGRILGRSKLAVR